MLSGGEMLMLMLMRRDADGEMLGISVLKMSVWSQVLGPDQPETENVQNQYRKLPFGAIFCTQASQGPKILKISTETSHLELVSEPGPRRRDSEGARAL